MSIIHTIGLFFSDSMLQNLPTELIVHIVAYLKANDILSFNLLSRHCHDVISYSVLLQYILELHRCGMEQFHDSALNVQDRRRYLLDRETNWHRLSLDTRQQLQTQFNVSGLYDLSSGVLILGENAVLDEQEPVFRNLQGRKVHSLELSQLQPPSKPGWEKLEFNARIVDIGLAIDEHDLIASVTSESFLDQT